MGAQRTSGAAHGGGVRSRPEGKTIFGAAWRALGGVKRREMETSAKGDIDASSPSVLRVLALPRGGAIAYQKAW